MKVVPLQPPEADESKSLSHEPQTVRRVLVRLNVFDMFEERAKEGTFKLKFYYEFCWQDPSKRLEVDGQQQLIPADKVDWGMEWTPQAVFSDAQGEVTYTKPPWFDVSAEYYALFGKPTVCMRAICTMKFAKTLNLREFPFDNQTFRVLITSNHVADEVQFVENLERASNFNSEAVDGKWIVNSIGWREPSLKEGKAGFYPELQFNISASRRPEYFVYNYIIVNFLIVLVSFTAFALEFDDLESRLAVSLMVLLSAVAFKQLIAERLPDLPYLTKIDAFCIFGILLLVLHTIVHVFIKIVMMNGHTMDELSALADASALREHTSIELRHGGLVRQPTPGRLLYTANVNTIYCGVTTGGWCIWVLSHCYTTLVATARQSCACKWKGRRPVSPRTAAKERAMQLFKAQHPNTWGADVEVGASSVGSGMVGTGLSGPPRGPRRRGGGSQRVVRSLPPPPL